VTQRQSLDRVRRRVRMVDLGARQHRQNVRKFTPLTQNLAVQVFLAAKRCNDVYASQLFPQRVGFALWVPAPNQNLPVRYQVEGIRIGDVGIITPEGSFSFIFNICVPRNDEINPRSLPEDFAPIYPPIDSIDIRKFPAFNLNSSIASIGIETSQDDAIPP